MWYLVSSLLLHSPPHEALRQHLVEILLQVLLGEGEVVAPRPGHPVRRELLVGAEAGGESAAVAAGKTVFTANCGTCHTLKEAGTSGTVGPNLDELEPDLATVEGQVESGGGGMPAFKGQLSAEEITDVATYVSTVAGTE